MELYKYLKTLWKTKYSKRYSIDEFMYKWLASNLAGDSIYEELLCDDLIGTHIRDFSVDHAKEQIEIKIFPRQ